MELDEFRKRLFQYTNETSQANSEYTKAFLFLEFTRAIFTRVNETTEVQADFPHNLYPDLEKSIKSEKTLLIIGRIDAVFGNPL